MNTATETAEQVDARKLYSKISWRLIPYIFTLYILAYIDRSNVGFAALEFKHDLHLSETVFGYGGAIFFLGQLMFDLPSNLFLQKIGPRLWIARIMISWGIVATCMMLIKGTNSFYLLRLLLGISEAGFFPGMILYLTYWFPSKERARAVAKFMTATSIAGVVGAELSRVLLKLEGVAGLHGWQWLFLMEGLPTILFGISVLFLMKDHPDDAGWLTEAERKWLDNELKKDRDEGGATQQHNLKDAFKLPMVWVLAGVFALSQLAVYTVTLWMPSILETMMHMKGVEGAVKVGRLGALPYLCAAICTVLVGWNSDRTGERRFHIAGCLTVSCAGFIFAAYAHTLPTVLGAFCLAAVGVWSLQGPFWALPTRVLGGRAAAGGVAVITMIGSIGSALGPSLTGKMKDLTHNFTAGLLVVGGICLLGAALCFFLKDGRPPEAAPAP